MRERGRVREMRGDNVPEGASFFHSGQRDTVRQPPLPPLGASYSVVQEAPSASTQSWHGCPPGRSSPPASPLHPSTHRPALPRPTHASCRCPLSLLRLTLSEQFIDFLFHFCTLFFTLLLFFLPTKYNQYFL